MREVLSSKDMIKVASDIIKEYYPDKMTVRQIYYQFVGRGFIPNTKSQYKRLSSALVDGRESGLIEWDAIEDRTRSIVGGSTTFIPWASESSWISESYLWSGDGDDPRDKVEGVLKFLDDVKIRIPRWWEQPWYVEVWLEKQALEGVFYSVTEALEVLIMPGRGYSSATFLHEAAERLSEVEDRDIAILYYGDFDPSGEDIERYVQEKMITHGIDITTFRRIALTREQIDEYNLPPEPAKISDSRYEKFVAAHGDEVVELDALPINVLKKIIKDSVADYFNMDIFNERSKLYGLRETRFRPMLKDRVRKWVEE